MHFARPIYNRLLFLTSFDCLSPHYLLCFIVTITLCRTPQDAQCVICLKNKLFPTDISLCVRSKNKHKTAMIQEPFPFDSNAILRSANRQSIVFNSFLTTATQADPTHGYSGKKELPCGSSLISDK